VERGDGGQLCVFKDQAVVNDRILADATGAAFTITLPLSTSLLENDTIQIIDIGGISATNNITVARNGAKIQNLTEDLTINVNNASLTLVYTGATFGWIIAGT
jgi:hypothetical protein